MSNSPNAISPALRQLLFYIAAVIILSAGYFVYAIAFIPPAKERETWLSELGESIGEVALWAMLFIYLRTALKMLLGKGPIARRLLPDYRPPIDASVFRRFIAYLDRTHVHVGIATVAIVALHILLVGGAFSNLFFIAVVALVIWQTVFGLVLRWRSSPANVKRFSYSVHAQLVTGIMLGVFAYLGHALVD